MTRLEEIRYRHTTAEEWRDKDEIQMSNDIGYLLALVDAAEEMAAAIEVSKIVPLGGACRRALANFNALKEGNPVRV